MVTHDHVDIKRKAQMIKMAKTYIDAAQIEIWEHRVCSEYQRERGSRVRKQQRRSVKGGERMERKKNRVVRKL